MGLVFSNAAATCRRRIVPLALGVFSICLVSIGAQDRLRSMPGYDQSQKMQAALQEGAAFVSGSITPSWAPNAQSFTYTHAGKTYRFEIATLTSTETAATQPGRGGGRGGPGAEALKRPQVAARRRPPKPKCPPNRSRAAPIRAPPEAGSWIARCRRTAN